LGYVLAALLRLRAIEFSRDQRDVAAEEKRTRLGGIKLGATYFQN
jgi:hypothetical protein